MTKLQLLNTIKMKHNSTFTYHIILYNIFKFLFVIAIIKLEMPSEYLILNREQITNTRSLNKTDNS